jgi:hypothetical protein
VLRRRDPRRRAAVPRHAVIIAIDGEVSPAEVIPTLNRFLRDPVPEEALMMPLDAKQPAAPTATGEPAQSFEYRGVTVRRIQRVATAVGTVKFAWRARVDVDSRGHSVTADSVAELGDKIDTILDGKK